MAARLPSIVRDALPPATSPVATDATTVAPASPKTIGGYAESDAKTLMDLWRAVVAVPNISSGRLLPDGRRAALVLETKDIENNAKVPYEQLVDVSPLPTASEASFYPPTPLVKPNATFYSPSGRRSARFVAVGADGDHKVEVWAGAFLTAAISLKKACKAPLLDGFFQNLSWNDEETAFVFVAERPPSVAGKLWDDVKAGSAQPFERRETWGELYTDFSCLTLVHCDVVARSATNILSDDFTARFSATMPVLVSDTEVWFAAYSHEPRRLGIAHCGARPNTVLSVAVAPSSVPSPVPVIDPAQFDNARNLRKFGSTIAFFSVAKGCRAHFASFSLNTIDVATRNVTAVVPIVDLPVDSEGFPGLYPASGNDLFWVSRETLLITSVRRSTNVVYVINVATKEVTVAPICAAGGSTTGTWRVLDVRAGSALLAHSGCVSPPRAVVWKVGDGGVTQEIFNAGASAFASAIAPSLSTAVVAVPAAHDTEVLVHRLAGAGVRDFIVFMHGGPHGTDTNSFSHQLFFFLCAGYDIASVNYGGSLGFGQRRVDELLGKIGENDVGDVMAAVAALRGAETIPSGARLFASGGSHGGYLAAQLTAQHPAAFAAAAMRNPVTCLSSIAFESDIPDWAETEAGVPDSTHAAAMFACSPMAHARNVRTPTLIGIGLGDLRVPPPQGIAWYHAVRAAGARARLLEYPGVGHSLDSVHSEADFAVNTALFFATV